MQVIIGSYTHKEKRGIHQYRFDEKNGDFTFAASYDEVENPSYLMVDPLRKHIYCVSETGGPEGGAVAQYSIDRDMVLKFEGFQPSYGDDPCHLFRFHDDLIVCNYSSGTVAAYPIDDQGRIAQVSQKIQHTGSSSHPERQAGPHVHFAAATPNKSYLAIVDLGIDQIIFYEPTEEGYKEYSRLICEAGSGPRHFVWHPQLPQLYVVNELSSSVTVYECSGDYKTFTRLQTIATIPSGFEENNQCAAIVMSRDSRFLYLTNRGHDSIASYSVDDSTGLLTLLEIKSTQGKWPRDCALSPDDAFLFAANEHSDCVTLFARDRETGLLDYRSTINVDEPTCIVFG